jgi:hypothetical protein
MPNLIARLATAADVTPDVARRAIAMIIDFMKRDAPDDAVKKLLEGARPQGRRRLGKFHRRRRHGRYDQGPDGGFRRLDRRPASWRWAISS